MNEQEMLLHCEAEHQWRETWPSPMVATAMVKRMKALKCPVCGSDKVFLGWGPQPIQDAQRGSIQQRANKWIASGDTGTSSKAIWTQMMDAGKPDWGWSPPWDPADLGRCLRLLEAVPEWKPRMPEMAARSPKWAALVARWDEVAQSMADEVGIDWSKGRKAPKTYALMKEILG